MGEVERNLEMVRDRIGRAAARAGRDPCGITLVAVSKGRSLELIAQAVRAGQGVFGENRAQELREKVDSAELEVEWHFVGHLQRNKVNMVVGKVALIHSVDSRSLLEAIARRASGQGLAQDILLQVNVSGEKTKHGMAEREVAGALEAALGLPGVRARGLMTMAPLGDEEEARHCFRRLRVLRDDLERGLFPVDAGILSMGMTEDFEVAVEEGADMVRIGTAIFAT